MEQERRFFLSDGEVMVELTEAQMRSLVEKNRIKRCKGCSFSEKLNVYHSLGREDGNTH